MIGSGWFLSCLVLWLGLIETSQLYNLYNVNPHNPFVLPRRSVSNERILIVKMIHQFTTVLFRVPLNYFIKGPL